MSIIKTEKENTIIYSLGEETMMTATYAENSVLKIEGAIKTLVAPCLDEAIKIAASKNETYSIDFSGVTYIASAGLRVLLNMQQDIDENDKPEVFITNVPDVVKEVFEQTGFNNILSIEE